MSIMGKLLYDWQCAFDYMTSQSWIWLITYTDASTHPSCNFNRILANHLWIYIGRELFITSHMKQSIWLLIAALILVDKRIPWCYQNVAFQDYQTIDTHKYATTQKDKNETLLLLSLKPHCVPMPNLAMSSRKTYLATPPIWLHKICLQVANAPVIFSWPSTCVMCVMYKTRTWKGCLSSWKHLSTVADLLRKLYQIELNHHCFLWQLS